MAEKIKFKASIKELAFEYEGTREVGQALQAGLSRSLAGLVDMQRTVMLPAPAQPVLPGGRGDGGQPRPAAAHRPAVHGPPVLRQPADDGVVARARGGGQPQAGA